MYKKLSILILLLFWLSYGFSQNSKMNIASFSLLENDQTANTPGTEEFDQNGEPCALIKVETNLKGFMFENGTLGITKVKQEVGEIWVYVPARTNKLTIKHQQLEPIRDYPLGMSLQPARTYLLKLICGEIQIATIIQQTNQYLCFSIEPKDANPTITVNNEIWPIFEGSAYKLVDFGHYQYTVTADEYHTEEGTIEHYSSTGKTTKNIVLRAKFGYLSITDSDDTEKGGAYIDNRYIGNLPIDKYKHPSGRHSLVIVKDLYKNYETDFEITDEQTTTISPSFIPNYALVTLKTDNNAEIWISNEMKGIGSWTGKLPSGNYVFETRLENHHPNSITQQITPDNNNHTIQIPSPTPIQGMIDIDIHPVDAEIYIDGVKRNELTPCLIPNILIGQHEIEIRKNGYTTLKKTIIVRENLKEPISGHLAKESTITKEASTAEAVDLGLSVKWASCNIGANAPEKTGNYYAWGEIFVKPSYNWSSYKYGLSAEELQKYCPLANYGSGGFTDSKNTLELTDDIASTKWGEQWRIPTKAEWEELHSKCKWEWTILNGVRGYKVTSRKNNNYIFLPVTGKYNGDATSNADTQGSYWTSTLYETYPNYAYVTRFDAKNILLAYYNRCYGLSIRPVFDSHAAHP